MKRFTHFYRSLRPDSESTSGPEPDQWKLVTVVLRWSHSAPFLHKALLNSTRSFFCFIKFYCENYVKTNFYLLNTKQLRAFLCILSKITTFLDKSKVYVKLTFCTFKWVHTGNNKVLLIESWDRLIGRWTLSEHLLYAMLMVFLAEKIDFTCTSSVFG